MLRVYQTAGDALYLLRQRDDLRLPTVIVDCPTVGKFADVKSWDLYRTRYSLPRSVLVELTFFFADRTTEVGIPEIVPVMLVLNAVVKQDVTVGMREAECSESAHPA